MADNLSIDVNDNEIQLSIDLVIWLVIRRSIVSENVVTHAIVIPDCYQIVSQTESAIQLISI